MSINKKAVSWALLIMILFSGLAVGTVSGTHENPNEDQEDFTPLFESLNVTADKMENPLKEALNVNYTLPENLTVNPSYEYNEEALNRSIKTAIELEEELSKPNSVFSDIEGDIESDEFLKEYYVPFYKIAMNLTQYSERHQYLVSNLSSIIIEYGIEEEKLMDDVGESFYDAHEHISAMKKKLENINAIIQEKKGDKLNLKGLESSIRNNERLLNNYTRKLGYVGEELDLPPTLFIYGPKKIHPNEEFEIQVNFFDGTTFNTSADVSLLIDGDKTDSIYEIKRNSYVFSYKVNWTSELWSEIVFWAQVEEGNITSDGLAVRVVPYPSNIELETDKEVYYNEMVTIHGLFQTDAEIDDLTEIDLYAPDKKISPDPDGSFVLEYPSKRFRWGLSEINVSYNSEENEFISSSSANVTFEVSIPTDIIITDYTEEVDSNDVSNFTLEGRLVNVSNGEKSELKGLGSQNLKIYLDGELIAENRTDDEGYFTFSFSRDQELEPGTYFLKISFKGSSKYRSIDTSDIQLNVIEEESQKENFWTNPLLMGGIATSLLIIFGLAYLTWNEKEDEKVAEIIIDDHKDTSSRISIPSASDKDDIPSSYRRFLETLHDVGFIELYKGKTHREIESEINSHLSVDELKKELRLVTDLFEKALFTDREINDSEIEEFNSSLSKLGRRVLS